MKANSITRVGVAIVQFKESFLVGVREVSQTLAGLHEFPGGKCWPDETPPACAVRECLEETGLAVRAVRVIDNNTHEYEHATVAVSFVLCEVEISGQDRTDSDFPKATGNFVWMHRSQLSECQFPTANDEIVQRLIENQV